MSSLARSIAVLQDAIEGLLGFLDIWPLCAQPTQCSAGVGERRCHFIGDRGGELPHRRGVVHMRQLDGSVVEPFIDLARLRYPAKDGAFISLPRRCGATMLTGSSVRRRQLHRERKTSGCPKTAVTPPAIGRAGRCWTSVVVTMASCRFAGAL
jgi:hypothetical protein